MTSLPQKSRSKFQQISLSLVYYDATLTALVTTPHAHICMHTMMTYQIL